MTETLSSLAPLFLTLHILGVVIGMGGATITDILFFDFLRDFTISEKEAAVMRRLSHIILLALAAIAISGLGLFLGDIPRYATSAAFMTKMILVGIVTINGVAMHSFVSPRLVELSFAHWPHKDPHSVHRLRILAFALGAVSFTSWYGSFFIAMLKRHLPVGTTVAHLMSGYAIILLCALVVSQGCRILLSRQASR